MNSLFCRHNRFTAECPICSRGTVLSSDAPERLKPARPARPSGQRRSGSRKDAAAAAMVTRYPHVAAGPFEREAVIYEVRLEKVPGGLRLGEWRNGGLEKAAPAMPAPALRGLVEDARERGIVGFDQLPERGIPGADDSVASEGRAGDMREELRRERTGDRDFVRLARWIFWPGAGGVGWELQDAPVMLPEARFDGVLRQAAHVGLI